MQFTQVVFYGRLGSQALTMFNLDPAHTMELQARRHPYATTSYDQGHEGLTDALELERQLGPVPT